MANAKATPVAPTLNPMVLALLANPKSRASLGDRLVNGATDVATNVTVAVGQLTQAFDTANFNDGVMIQKLRAVDQRASRWAKVQQQYHLSDADVAALINS